MPKKNKKKKGGKKKGGKKITAAAPRYVDNDDEVLEDFMVEAPKKKKKEFTGFEEGSAAIASDEDSWNDEEEEVVEVKPVQTGGKKSRAQLKKEKKERQKKEAAEKKKQEAQEKAKAAKKKKSRAKYDDDDSDYSSYSDSEPRKKGKSKAKRRKDSDDYSDYSYSDSYEPKKKSTKKKTTTKKKSSRKYSDDYSDSSDDYSSDYDSRKKSTKKQSTKKKSTKKKTSRKYSDEHSDDYSDNSSEPKKTTKKPSRKYSDSSSSDDDYEPRKKKAGTKKKSARKYNDEYSDYSDSYDAPKSKKKNSKKNYDYSDDYSDYSDDLPPKKSKGKAKKKQPKVKGDPTLAGVEPTKKKPLTFEEALGFSDDDEPVVKKKPAKKKTKTIDFFALLDEDDDEDEDEDEFWGRTGDDEEEEEREPTPEPEPAPVVMKKSPPKQKKKTKADEALEAEFGDLFADEKPKTMSKAAKKRARKKADQKAKEEGATSPTTVQTADTEPAKPKSKAALKRDRQKKRKQEEKLKAAQAAKDGPPNKEKNLTAKQKERLEKYQKQKEEQERRKQEEIDRKKREEEERRKQEEEERIAAEEAAIRKKEKQKKAAERAKLRAAENKRAAALSKLQSSSQGGETRQEKMARLKALKEKKKGRKGKKNSRFAQEQERRRQEELERKRQVELERKRREEEELARKEAEEKRKLEEEEAARHEAENKAITERALKQARKKKAVKKPVVEEGSEDEWEDGDSGSVDEPSTPEDEKTPKHQWSDDESEDWDADKPVAAKPKPEPVVETPPASAANEWSDDESEEMVQPQPKPQPKKVEPVKKETKQPSPKASKGGNQGGKKASKKDKKKKKKEVDMSKLRAPIGVIMGNVDAGKTALLDYIRQTKVQQGEAGGITQQIGATNLPIDYIINKAGKENAEEFLKEVHLPGLLIIDTPGHGAFDNLRKRGSSMCDIAIVVVNIMNGMEGTTEQCIKMLKEADAPFIIALNQVDKIDGWVPHEGVPIRKSLSMQTQRTQDLFHRLWNKVFLDAAQCHLNAYLFWENQDLEQGKVKNDNISCVPTSAFSGCGVSDLLLLWIKLCQLRKLAKKLVLTEKLACTILEVKKVQGYGHTIDVILTDGTLRIGDTIAICGMNGPITTEIRGLLQPKTLQDLRVKSEYNNLNEVHGSCGVRIAGKASLESSVPGSQILAIPNPENEYEVEDILDDVQAGLQALIDIEKSDRGVYVVASTLGSLEALVNFLRTEVKVPISGTSIGRVHKKDVMKASVMLQHQPEYACILAFDVTISPVAADLADTEGVRIFHADIIYHLQDMFKRYVEEIDAERKASAAGDAVFPCVLESVKDKIFNRKNPIVLGVKVAHGNLRIGTPLCAWSASDGKTIFLGEVESIRDKDDLEIRKAKTDSIVSVKIARTQQSTTLIEFGRHFGYQEKIVSQITRESIDCLRKFFRDEVSQDEVKLLKKLKRVFKLK